MAIYTPGVKFRNSKLLSKKRGGREMVALLSLTAMVDMFTVLVIFLLQNYNAEGLIVNTPKDLILPEAKVILELKPAVLVTVSEEGVFVDENQATTLEEIRAQKEWMVANLYYKTKDALAEAKAKAQEGALKKLKKVVQAQPQVDAKSEDSAEDLEAWRNITIQADKQMDILTLKKIMATLSEAGAGRINFAVLKKKEETNQ